MGMSYPPTEQLDIAEARNLMTHLPNRGPKLQLVRNCSPDHVTSYMKILAAFRYKCLNTYSILQLFSQRAEHKESLTFLSEGENKLIYFRSMRSAEKLDFAFLARTMLKKNDFAVLVRTAQRKFSCCCLSACSAKQNAHRVKHTENMLMLFS